MPRKQAERKLVRVPDPPNQAVSLTRKDHRVLEALLRSMHKAMESALRMIERQE